MTGLEPAGLAVAKSVGPKLGMAAFKKLHPDDWQRRLTKSAAAAVKRDEEFRVSGRRLRLWLKEESTEPLLDRVFLSGGEHGTVEAADSLDRTLCGGRKWRKAPPDQRQARCLRLVEALSNGLIAAQSPSSAVDLASRRTSTEIAAVRADLAAGRDAGSHAEFLLAVESLPAEARTSLTRLEAASDTTAVRRIVMSLGDVGAQPTALIPVWITQPPTWLVDDAAGWAALGVLAEEYLFVAEAVQCWTKAAELGSPRRDYWLLRAAWLLFEQSLPGEDDTQLAEGRTLAARVGDLGIDFTPPATALFALIDGRGEEVAELLREWTPDDIADRSLRTRMLFVSVLASAPANGLWAAAVAVLKPAFDKDPLPRTGLMLSRAMVQQSYAEPSADRVDLLNAAYDVAVDVRDMLRAVRAPSMPAVKAAVEAAEMATDELRILRVATNWTDFGGQANERERGSAQTAQAVVAAALLLGSSERARTLAESLPPGYERALCLAMCEDLVGTSLSQQQKQAMWHDVLGLACDTSERLPAWDGLARAGAAELPGMREQIGDGRAAIAAGLEATAAAARGFPDDAVRMLLPYARADMTAARQLAKIYDDRGERVNAARTLLEAGIDFHNPDLLVHAAGILNEHGEHSEAKTAIDRALTEHGAEWANRPVALRVAAHIAEASKHLAEACDYLASALRLKPAHADNRWYLIQLLCQRGLSQQAWQVIADSPTEITVRGVDDARAWLDACYHGGPGGEVFIAQGLRLLDQFPDDERLAAAVLVNGISIELSPTVLTAYQAAFQRFLHLWPESRFLRQIPFPSDDPEEMRAVLDDLTEPGQDHRDTAQIIASQVQAGRVPLAILAALLRRTYTETLIQRAAGPLVATSATDPVVGVATAREALDGDVVIDLAAMHVLAELFDSQPDLATIVDVSHRQILVTEAVSRDIRLGVDALTRPVAGTWVPPSNGNPGYASPLDDAERLRVTRCSTQLQDQLRRLRVVPNPPTVTVFGERTHDADLAVWDRTIQVAHELNHSLWSDDAVTRAMARDSGVSAFSTLDLLAVLTERGRVTPAELQNVHQTMLERGIADVPFSAQSLRQASSVIDWQTGYAGLAVARPETWRDPPRMIGVWTEFVRSVPRDKHDRLPSWTYVAVAGASRAPYVLGAAAARNVVAQVLQAAVYLTASNPTIVSACVSGCEAALVNSEVKIEDPVPVAVQNLRDAFVKQGLNEQVAPYLLAAFSSCSESVQSTVRRSLLL